MPLPCLRGRDNIRHRNASLVGLGQAISLVGVLADCQSQPTAEFGVYSGRHNNTDKELYRAFTSHLVRVDATRLDRAARPGPLQPFRSAPLECNVPAALGDPKGCWFALTRRVQLLVLHPSLGEELARSCEEQAQPELRGCLCLRDSRSVYDQSLVADQQIGRGEAASAAWERGMVANLGEPRFSSDIPLARTVAGVECGAALARRLRVMIPDPAHGNGSGAGVMRHSRQVVAASRLIAFLASPKGGRGYAAANHEYLLRSEGIGAAQLGEGSAAVVARKQANGWR